MAKSDPARGSQLWRLLTYRISTLSKLYHRQLGRYLSTQHQLAPAEWFILGHLAEASPQTLRSLADLTLLDKGQLSRAAARLVAQQLVARSPDPADARSALFDITPAGRRVQEAVMEGRRQVNRDLDRLLTADERAALESALTKLSDYFRSADGPR